MLTESGRHCWVCDKWIYTLVFWSRNIGTSACIYLEDDDKDRIIEQLELINHDNEFLLSDNIATSPSNQS